MKATINGKLLKKVTPKNTPYHIYDSALPGFILRVQPTGSMTYYVEYRLDGRKRRYQIGPASKLTPELARDEAKLQLARATTGADPVGERKAARAETIGELIEGDYTGMVLDHRKSGKATRARLESCFKAEFWTRKLDDPTLHNAITNWRSQRLKGNGAVAVATVDRDIAALKAAIAWALDQDYIKTDPLRKIRIKTPHNERIRYLTVEEETRLMTALDTREGELRAQRDRFNLWRRERHMSEFPSLRTVAFADHLKPMVLLSLYTGMRRGEVFSLTWADVDLKQAIITIRAAAAKSGRPRHVPMNGELLDVMTQWRKQTEGDGLVFESAKTGGRFDNTKSSWRALLDNDHANITDFHWHDMRHHFASKLVMAGVDLNTVRELLGHADLKMTLRYAHLAPHVKAAAVEKLKLAAPNNIVAFPAKEETA